MMDAGAMFLTFLNEQELFATINEVPNAVLHVFQGECKEISRTHSSTFKDIVIYIVRQPRN
jgi:hypothetical protein